MSTIAFHSIWVVIFCIAPLGHLAVGTCWLGLQEPNAEEDRGQDQVGEEVHNPHLSGNQVPLPVCTIPSYSVILAAFYSYPWRCCVTLAGLVEHSVIHHTSDVTPLIPGQTGLQLSVPSSQGFLTLCKYWPVTFQPFSINAHDYLCLFLVVHYQLLLSDYYLIYCTNSLFMSDSGIVFQVFCSR